MIIYSKPTAVSPVVETLPSCAYLQSSRGSLKSHSIFHFGDCTRSLYAGVASGGVSSEVTAMMNSMCVTRLHLAVSKPAGCHCASTVAPTPSISAQIDRAIQISHTPFVLKVSPVLKDCRKSRIVDGCYRPDPGQRTGQDTDTSPSPSLPVAYSGMLVVLGPCVTVSD